MSDPYEGYPAMKAEIWAGDEIVEVDGRRIQGMDTEEVSKLLKGQAGSQVKAITQRLGMEPVMHELVREEIKIPDVPYKGMVDAAGEVGYIKLNSFTQTAGQEVRNALKELKEQGAKKMILDLRGNGGGLLREAVNIVNLFVPKNELVVETKGKIPEWDKTYKTLSEPVDATIPLVVLVDGNSASASEIVSGAFRPGSCGRHRGAVLWQGPGATNTRPLLQQQAESDRGQVLHPQRPLHPEVGLRPTR
ncbi:MAG: hypothetical protein IPH05_10180 [Flavobacteriales bacterium]|nr:hypothetical protein [Flavobacteriales bacterium]